MPHRFVIPIAITLLLAGCAAGADPPGQTPAGPSSSVVPSAIVSPSHTASLSPTAPPSPTVAAARLLDVRIAGGQVSGVEPRVSVALGESIVVRVTSDVADEVHIHGYDLRRQIFAGGTVELPLTATIPGGFEVELEKLGRTLFQLRVS